MSRSEGPDADVLIIGAGPVGLYAAYCAGFRGLSTIVVDALPQVGGQVLALYPEKLIRDVAALPEVRGRDFIQGLLRQATTYSPRLILGREVQSFSHEERGVRVLLDDGSEFSVGAVVVTAGIGAPRPRRLGCGEEWLDVALSYFVLDPGLHRDQHVIVVGGGDSALDWADTLADVARSVTLVHRRATFRGHAATLDRVQRKGVRLLTDSNVVALSGDRTLGDLTSVVVEHETGRLTTLPADHVVAALGFVSNLGPLRSWGFELDGRALAVDRSMRTSLPNVYAAGDVASYPGRVGLMSVGFGEAATAINHLAVERDPSLTLLPGHSTDETMAPAPERKVSAS